MSRRARATIALLAIAACARTPAATAPQAPAPATPPAPAPKAAAPPAPSAPVTLRSSVQDIVGAVVFRDGVVYALSWGGRLRAWTGDAEPARTLDLQHVLAIAADGSVAATKTKDGDDSERLDVWALPDLARVRTRSFEHGVESVLALSRGAAYVRLNFHNHGGRGDGALMSQPPPRYYDVFWTFAADTVVENRWFPCDPIIPLPGMFMFSADGRRFACMDAASVEWRDLPSGTHAHAELAPDWVPPPPPRDLKADLFTERNKPGGVHVNPFHDVLSLRLAPDGRHAYVTYHREKAHGRGWRLERWTPGKANTPGTITRLASEDADSFAGLLAISADGKLAVLGAGRQPLIVRRAPGYAPEPLAAESATAAAVSADGKRIATGHSDGSLRLWDAPTGRLIATTSP